MILPVALLFLGLTAAAAEVRTWSDSTGQFKIQARYVASSKGMVTLAKEDGTEIEVDLKKLSAGDQKYVAEQARADANPFRPKASDPFRPKAAAGASKGRSKTETETGGDEGHVVVPDWSKATAVLVAPTGSSWKVAVGPPVHSGARFAMRPIPLPARAHFFEKAVGLVLNPVCRRAVVGYNRAFPPNEGTTTRLVLCDLEKGKLLGNATQTGVVLAPIALHDDGNQVLLRRDEQGGGKQDRLEIWSFGPSGIERGLQWIAYDDLQGDKRDVKWAEFLDAKRVATISKSGKLAVWELGSETVRPLFFLDVQDGSTPALSPDRKHIAFSTGKDVGMLDVDAGKVVAMQSVSQVTWPVLAFSPSGKRFGCASSDRMYIWKVNDGTLDREVPYNGGVALNGKAIFTSDDHVLLGKSVLMDLENQVKLWTYQGADLVDQRNGLCWFLPTTSPQQAGALVPSKIPQPGVEEALKKAMADPNFFVLKAGKVVKLNLDGLTDPAQRDKVQSALESRLKANGIKVGPDGTIELIASTEVGKEREVAYRTIGRGFPAVRVYKVKEYISRVKFVYQGLTAWEASAINIPFFARLKPGETMEEHLKAQEKPNYAYFDRVQLPKLLTRPTANGVTALGNAQVTTSGVR